MILQYAYPMVFYVFIPLLFLITIARLFFYKGPIYSYPLATFIKKQGLARNPWHKKLLFILRFLSLLGLIFLIARPRWVDENSRVNVEGVDIVLAIDASESMQVFDDPNDSRSRIDVAKEEAINFIEKRVDDPIGIVAFGQESISLCPLTLDKTMLKNIVGDIEIGQINPHGTWLGTGLATAVNRLRKSKAKSKVIILLTDGEPTPPEKIDPETATDLAKKFGIKVYTIGIGNEQGGFVKHHLFGLQRIEFKINVELLKKIADYTGGLFFRANNPKELKKIYAKIDELEKTKYETSVYHHYYEAFASYIWILLLLLGLEFFLKFFRFYGI
jgi:Ca-activated chloride channel family protein